jgi:DNA repair protein RecO (recombination protein O)
MLHKTRGIVVRQVKYGETSLIVTIFTEKFGMQSYMVKGVRKSGISSGLRASQFQPSNILDLVVTHHDRQGLHHIRECQWARLYRTIDRDIRKQTVVIFMMEVLQKCLKQPDPMTELFQFTEDALVGLDEAEPLVSANFPIFFALHLTHFFGFRMEDSTVPEPFFLDLQEGIFIPEPPDHPHWADPVISDRISQFLKVTMPSDLPEIPLNRDLRRQLLEVCMQYYRLHLSDFGPLRSLPVLQTLLD